MRGVHSNEWELGTNLSSKWQSAVAAGFIHEVRIMQIMCGKDVEEKSKEHE